MLSSVVKDCGEVFTRLFDHRPFTNGEINYFVREFEESRKDREQARLAEIQLCIDGIKKCRVSDPEAVTANFNKLNALIDIATHSCETILDNQKLFDPSVALKDSREERAKQWENFNREVEIKMTEIDSTFVEKEKELIGVYKDLERKLHLTN